MKNETVLGFALIRTDRKTVGITVKAGGEVQVRAPKRMRLCDIECVVEKHRAWIQKAVEKTKDAPPMPSAEAQKGLRARAEAVLPPLVAAWSERTGLVPTSVRITSARRRFGSCSGKNGLCFSLFLMQYPMEAVEYVVVHELCHIRHHHHGKEFWDLVACCLPDYRERKRMLT